MEVEESPFQHLSYNDLNPDSVLHGDLDSGTADYVIQLLRIQFPGVEGLLPPSQLYALTQDSKSYIIPRSKFAVQIHVYPGHYLVSAQINGSLFVIDSLYHQLHLSSVMPQLKILYTESAVRTLKYISPQTQGSTNLCGFFSIACAYYVLFNKSVPNVNFHMDQMRNHLKLCLNNGEITGFPCEVKHNVRKGANAEQSTSVSHIDLLPVLLPEQEADKQLMDKYFADQNKKTLTKKMTKREKYNLKVHRQREKRQKNKVLKEKVASSESKLKKRKQIKCEGLSELEKEKKRAKDRERKHLKRQQMSESEKRTVLDKDRNRKIVERSKFQTRKKYLQTSMNQKENIRQSKTEKEKKQIRDRDRLAHKLSRGSKTEKEKQTERYKNRISHKVQREAKTDKEKQIYRRKDRLAHKVQRDAITDQEKQTNRDKNRISHKVQRVARTEQQKQTDRDTDRISHKVQRDARTEQQKQRYRDTDRISHKVQRDARTEQQKQTDRDTDRISHKVQRAARTEQEKQTYRDTDRISRKVQRDARTEQQKQRYRDTDRISHKVQRDARTEQQKQTDRDTDRISHKVQRDARTEQDKQTDRDKNKISHKVQRDARTEQQKQTYRDTDRISHKVQRDARTDQQKQIYRDKDRISHIVQRDARTDQQKQTYRDTDRISHIVQRDARTDQQKQTDRNMNKISHKVHRGTRTEQEKQTDRGKDRISHKLQRDAKSDRDKQNIRTTDRLRTARKRKLMDEEKKEIEREKHRSLQQKRRKYEPEHIKEMERETDRLRHCNKRNASRQKQTHISKSNIIDITKKQLNDVLQTFFHAITEGPTYICCCCNRFLYRSSVKRLTQTIIVKSSKVPNLVLHFNQSEISWICDTCLTNIQKRKLPCQAVANNLDVEQVPLPLKDLYSLEKQLICKIIPFMKILSLPAGSQHGFKGQVVLVPCDLEKTTTALPRQTEDTQIIALTLKRRLSDKYGSARQYIRPNSVNKALTCLRNTNLHYSDTRVNDNWAEESKTNDETFWNSVSQTSSSQKTNSLDDSLKESKIKEVETQQFTTTNVDASGSSSEKTDSEDEVDHDNPLEVVEDLSLKRSLNSTTCLYPEFGPSVPGNKILNLAPGEGQVPVSVFYQKHWETLAFPTLFPTGKGSFHEDRQIPISPKKYVISRLLSKHPRFAESPEYTFQCLHWIESTTVSDSISMSLKKSRQSAVTVRQLQDPQHVHMLFKDDELFASFKKVRGTPQYWKEMQQNMLAKIRHFGTSTFFLSGSAADFHMPELIKIVAKQYGEHYSIDFIEHHMDKKTKRNWLARNPVTVARHIDFIFRKLWGNVILSGVHPVGQILNYDIRKEMQNRGTAHFHSAIHVMNAPVLDKNSDDEVITFVDKYITCSVPPTNEPLKELVLSRQTHHHTRTCKKKKGLNCRFHFPKPPSESTVIARQPDGELAKFKMESARKVLTTVMQTLEQTGTDINLDDLLEAASVTKDDYSQALKSSLKKSSIILKRNPAESHVNPYNPVILTALRANMDIQYITDVWACIAYITSYMCKPERNMSDLMRNACKEANTVKEKLKKIGSTFLKSREVSQHEAIARLLGLPLRETNTPVLFVPTGYRHQRTRLLKPPQLLQKMDNDDTDIFQPNIIDKYSARPNNLEKMCLAEFAANYLATSRFSSTDDTLDEIENDKEQPTTKTIRLKGGLGIMKKRQKPVILRDYPVSREKDSEKYYYRLLLLYLPWRKEEELEDVESFEEKFTSNFESIENTIQHYEPYLEEVYIASTMCDTENCDEEIWDNIAPQVEQHRNEEAIDDPEFSFIDPINLTSDQLQGDIDASVPAETHFTLTPHVHIEPQARYFTMVQSLNQKQRTIHNYIFRWCRQMNLAISPGDEPSPFYIFMSGPAGVGKSHVIYTVYQTAIRNLRKAGNTPDSPTVLLTAPTGKAAVNIGGTTLHTAFHLPVRKAGSYFGYTRPSMNNLNSMRANYCNLKLLIIDEISMVSSKVFSHFDLTLQEVFENNRLFGGLSVLTVGDLLQLQPVGEKPVFNKEGRAYEALAPSPWDKFLLFELTDIVRQKGDPEFANMLSRIRIGKHTQHDIDTLKGLETTPVSEGSVSVFLTNSLKDMYNTEQLLKLDNPVYTIKAVDSKKDLHTGRIPVIVTNSNIHQTGGLSAEIKVAKNARYMHTKNTDIAEGLINGATGSIKELEIPSQKPLSGTLYVKFDDSNVGKQLKQTCKFKGLVPIKAVTAVFSVTENSTSLQVERTQFPGSLAWGITVHKAQGSTYAEMIADMTYSEKQKTTMPGQIYTMLSRSKSMDRLRLVSFNPSKIIVNNSALEEMKRLTSYSLDIDEIIPSQSTNECFIVSYLNIRSLKAHYEDLKQDSTIHNSHVLCLSETKVSNYTKYPLQNKNCLTFSTKHGLAVYHTSALNATQVYLKEKLNVAEVMVVKFPQVAVISVYIAPSVSYQAISTDFKHLLHYASTSEFYSLIIGDFNTSLSQRNQLERDATASGFLQLVEQPTHELGSILDIVFTNYPAENCHLLNIPVYYSDHHLIAVNISTNLVK